MPLNEHRKEIARALTNKSRVVVNNGNIDHPTTWEGRVLAIINEPAILIQQDNGNKIMLPMRFNIEVLAEEESKE